MAKIVPSVAATLGLLLAGMAGTTRADILVNKAGGGKVLDAHSPDVKENGCRVQLWEYKDASQQQWQLKSIGGGYYLIVNKAGGLVFDAHSDDVNQNGCRVQLWQYVRGARNQQWSLKREGEYFKIVNRASGKVLDAHSDDVGQDGCRVQLWDDNDGEQCLWKIE